MERDKRRVSSVLAAAMERPQANASGVEIVAPKDTAALFADVKSARSRAVSLGVADIVASVKALNERTRKQYSRTNRRRLLPTGPDMAGVSRSSWYPTRAALKAGLAARFQNAMRDQDKAQKAGDFETAQRHVQTAKAALDGLEAIGKMTPPPTVKGTHSARKRLPKAKGDTWQSRVYAAATDTMRPAVAVMWATGARPAELEAGVDVERVKGGIRVRIPGVKVNDARGTGQPVRVLLIDENTPAGRALAAALGEDKKITVKRRASRIAKDFSDHIRPRLPASYEVSAYSFRHQASANMKTTLDADTVAQAMGHRTTRSQQNYGTSRQAQSGGGAVIGARATHKPKETRGLVVSPPRKPDGPSFSM